MMIAPYNLCFGRRESMSEDGAILSPCERCHETDSLRGHLREP